MSLLVAAGEVVWVVASVKQVSSPLDSSPGGGTTWLEMLVWGHQFVAPMLISPKPWRMSQLVNVTCSHTTSLSSTTPPAKGQKSGLSGRLSSSAQYCSPLA